MASLYGENITPEQQQGLVLSSILSAGIGALTGNSKREAILNAVKGGVSAYTGGSKDILSMNQQELNRQRILDAARQQSVFQREKWEYNKRIDEQNKERQAIQDAMSADRFGWEKEDRPQNAERQAIQDAMQDTRFGWEEEDRAMREKKSGWEEEDRETKQQKTIDAIETQKAKKQKWQEILSGGKDPGRSAILSLLPPEKGIPYLLDKPSSKKESDKKETLTNDIALIKTLSSIVGGKPLSLGDQKALDNLRDKNPTLWALADKGGKSKLNEENTAILQSIIDSLVAKVGIPKEFPPGSKFMGKNENGEEMWLLPDGSKPLYRR